MAVLLLSGNGVQSTAVGGSIPALFLEATSNPSPGSFFSSIESGCYFFPTIDRRDTTVSPSTTSYEAPSTEYLMPLCQIMNYDVTNKIVQQLFGLSPWTH